MRERPSLDHGRFLVRSAAAALLLVALRVGMAPIVGRPDGTAIPGEAGTVVQTPVLCSSLPDCHVDNPVNDIGNVEILNAPAEYEPGRTYDLGLEITGFRFTRRYGFQLAAFFAGTESQAGTLEPTTPATARFDFEGLQLLTHLEPLESGDVSFRWTAPDPAAGPVTLRVASNSANNDNSERGDHIATAEVTIPPAQGFPELEVFYFPQIGVGTFSAGGVPQQFTTELIFVDAGERSPLIVEVLDGSGSPLEVDVQVGAMQLPGQTRFETELAAGQAVKLTLTSAAPVQAGYARVTAAASVGGTAVFTQSETGGRILYEAGVPASRPLERFSLAAQTEPGLSDTGLALVRPGSGGAPAGAGAQVTLRLYDAGFQLLEETAVELAPGQHLPRFLTQFFPGLAGAAESFQGSVTVSSDRPLAAVTLRQTVVPTLTAFPVIEGSAGSP